ncbi:hypothetical protein LCGC14_1205140 [marine sediment metagenome]|uniref:Uncharacterized protein n=1 Tax=marine sediment metagenome TaxID=412755 RepID=A0A0F9NY58_9ZZZZ
MGEGKSDSLFWEEDTGKDIVKVAWSGTKAVGVIVLAGLAVGLGLNAYGAVSS